MQKSIDQYAAICKKPKTKKLIEAKGRYKRFNKIKQKANNYSGFGERIPENSSVIFWYLIEYNRETKDEQELIEIHWLKVEKPQGENAALIRRIMRHADLHDVNFSPADFVASSHFGCSVSSPRDKSTGLSP